MKNDDVTITKNYDGSYTMSAIRNGYLVHRRFSGYTKREAIRLFKLFVNPGTDMNRAGVYPSLKY